MCYGGYSGLYVCVCIVIMVMIRMNMAQGEDVSMNAPVVMMITRTGR